MNESVRSDQLEVDQAYMCLGPMQAKKYHGGSGIGTVFYRSRYEKGTIFLVTQKNSFRLEVLMPDGVRWITVNETWYEHQTSNLLWFRKMT